MTPLRNVPGEDVPSRSVAVVLGASEPRWQGRRDTRRRTHSWRGRAIVLLVAWGALAFGAPYPWAFTPLFVLSAVVGVAAFLQQPSADGSDRLLVAALALLILAIGSQLVPLSLSSIRLISPETDLFLRAQLVGYEAAISRHPLSIQPAATTLALLALIALTVFLFGSAHALTEDDARDIALGVSVIGALLAAIGIVQKALWNGKLYGVWTPEQVGSAFGPFNNHNHFAGWILMALPLATGYLCGRLMTNVRGPNPNWRNRLLLLSSRSANKTIFLAFCILAMGIALVLTLSRSGLLGFVGAMTAFTALALRGASARGRLPVVIFLALVVFVALGWTGIERIASRFPAHEVANLGGRLGIWSDTLQVIKRFPLVGTGVNTFGAGMRLFQTADPSVHFGEAHNDYLQLASEGGLLVCIPAALAILACITIIGRRFRDIRHDSVGYWIQVGAVTGLIAMAVQEAADFSLQMPGNAVLFTVLLVIAMRQSGKADSHNRPTYA